MQIVIQIFD